MDPVAFGDLSGLTAKQRRVAATAKDTLFPTLLPAPAPQPARQPEPQMDGQADLFGEEA
jgi:hypothetical protein